MSNVALRSHVAKFHMKHLFSASCSVFPKYQKYFMTPLILSTRIQTERTRCKIARVFGMNVKFCHQVNQNFKYFLMSQNCVISWEEQFSLGFVIQMAQHQKCIQWATICAVSRSRFTALCSSAWTLSVESQLKCGGRQP